MKIEFDYFIRNLKAGDYLETFLISAGASILVIRTFLSFTNYWQLGSGIFHISHIIWGGLLMMVAIIMLLAFLNSDVKMFSVVLAGVGFGAFIDELGKFITSDYNYFFQPTISLIYVVFVLIFLVYRFIDKPGKITEKEYAVNALEMIKEAVIYDLDEEEKKKAIDFLKKSNPEDPIIRALNNIIHELDTIPLKKKWLVAKLRDGVRNYYSKIIKNRYFASFIITISIVLLLLSIIISVMVVNFDRSFAEWGILVSSSVSGLFVLFGIYSIQRSRRLGAYKMFKFAILVSIFLTQFFLFFEEQFSAIIRLAIIIVIWSVLQNLIHQETLVQENGAGA